MRTRSLALALVLLALLVPAGAAADPRAVGPAEPASIYLPLISREPATFRVEVTSNGGSCTPFDCGYPHYYTVRGYVHSLVDTPLYSVTVTLEVAWIPYIPEFPEGVGLAQEELTLALPALLPGQPNPFGIVYTLGKGDISNVSVSPGRWSAGSADGRSYHALTVVRWERAGDMVRGVVRNDSGRALRDLRVVSSHPYCAWQVATVSAAALAPAQEASFEVKPYCSPADLRIAGQGAAE